MTQQTLEAIVDIALARLAVASVVLEEPLQVFSNDSEEFRLYENMEIPHRANFLEAA